MISFTLAWRYLKGRGLRTLLTTLAVVLGVMLIFGLNGIIPTMVRAFRQATLAAAGEVDLSITADSDVTFGLDVFRKVARVPGVAAATPSLRKLAALPPVAGVEDQSTQVSAVTVIGIDPRTVTEVRSFPLASGRFLTSSDGDVAVMGAELAAKLSLKVGDDLVLPSAIGSQHLRVVGLLSTPAVPGQEEVFVPLSAAQRQFALPDRINSVDVAYEAGADRESVEQGVKRVLGDGYTTAGLGSADQLLAALQMGEFAYNMFGIFALVAGGFVILNTFRTVVSERRHDIGMLRAIGATRGTVVGIFLVESLFQGILGTAMGIGAGWLMATGLMQFLQGIMAQYMRMSWGRPEFTVNAWVLSITLGMGVTIAAAIFPALSAGRVTPLEALRPMIGTAYEQASRRRGWVGGIMCAIAIMLMATRQSGAAAGGSVLFIIGLALAAPVLIQPLSDAFGALFDKAFKREGRIARSNLQRNPGRSATTTTAVMIALGIVIAMFGVYQSIYVGFMNYIDQAMGADFLLIPNNIVLSQGNVGAGPRLMSKIEHTQGIADVGSLRLGMAKVEGASVQVIGIDPEAYPKVADFVWSPGSDSGAIKALATGHQIIANGIYASQNGYSPGDTIALETPRGTVTYRVAGVGSDYLNAKLATLYISQDELENQFGVTTDVLVMATLQPGADRAAVRASLDEVIADFPAFKLYESAQWREEQVTVFGQSMVMMYGLMFALAAPSLLALMNTLAMSVLARTREIGMLRAVGSTRSQIKRMVLAESLLLSAIGTLFGIASGILLGYALVQSMTGMFPMPYTFPTGGVIGAVVIGITFALLAALLPARQASRLDVVEALHYE